MFKSTDSPEDRAANWLQCLGCEGRPVNVLSKSTALRGLLESTTIEK